MQTTDYLTKFEFARVLGLRVLQLSESGTSRERPMDVAMTEIVEGRNEMVVRRRLPDGSHEDRAVRDLLLSTHLKRVCASDLHRRAPFTTS